MSVWCVLATVLVAPARVVQSFSSTAGFARLPSSPRTTAAAAAAPGAAAAARAHQSSCGSVLRIATMAQRPPSRRYLSTMQRENNLWWRRHRREVPSARLDAANVNTDAPEVAPHGLAEHDAVAVEGASSQGAASSDKLRGRSDRGGLLLLATVPLVWGTYGPSVKYMYQMGDGPPGLVFNFGCYLVSVATFAAVAWVNGVRRRMGASEVPETKAIPPQDRSLADRYATRAGLELGAWLFLGGTVQVWGLQLTSASRAAFLVQLTTVIVPVLEAFLGRQKLEPQVWLACALATVGVALVSLGGMLPPGANVIEYITGSLSATQIAPSGLWESVMSGKLRGDLLVALSAVFYSLHVVRLGVHVSKVETLSLARAKALAELGFSALSLVVAGFIGGQGETFVRFASSLASKPELLLVFSGVTVWNGVLTSAYAMWAQTRGQAVVAPSVANLVYSLQPLWSTFFAVVLLKESFREVETAGAALVLLALFLATTQGDTPEDGAKDAAADRAA